MDRVGFRASFPNGGLGLAQQDTSTRGGPVRPEFHGGQQHRARCYGVQFTREEACWGKQDLKAVDDLINGSAKYGRSWSAWTALSTLEYPE